jgi:hypothetical protein
MKSTWFELLDVNIFQFLAIADARDSKKNLAASVIANAWRAYKVWLAAGFDHFFSFLRC